MTLRQVQYAAIDLELHARYVPAPGRTVFDGALDAVVARTTVMPPLPEDRCGRPPCLLVLERGPAC